MSFTAETNLRGSRRAARRKLNQNACGQITSEKQVFARARVCGLRASVLCVCVRACACVYLLSVCVCLCRHLVCAPVHLCVCVSVFCVYVCASQCMCVRLSNCVHFSICVFVCLSVCFCFWIRRSCIDRRTVFACCGSQLLWTMTMQGRMNPLCYFEAVSRN